MAFRSSKLTQQHKINMKEIEEKVRKAKSEKKVFIILAKYEALRNGLVMRGWLERVLKNQFPYIPPASERLIIAGLLESATFHFIWQARHRPIKINDNTKPFINSIYRQRQFDFTTKDGLKNCADSFLWNFIDGTTELNYHPRTHILEDKSTKDEFFEDYRKTAFTSFIHFLNTAGNLSLLFSTTGKILTDCIDFTIQKIELLMKIDDHEDIDMSPLFDSCVKFPKDQKKTLYHIQQIIKGNKKFKFVSDSLVEKYASDVKNCAEKIECRWPNLKYDGYHNIWIFKPLDSSSGNGILLENDDEKMREIISNTGRTFIAQKYIERTLLIHNRKFDIRIYLLTMIKNETIYVWLYKDCYIKFATKAFNLDDLHRSIHVTNYAIQKHFMNENNAVPNAKENMWTLKQLIEYFGTIQQPRLWEGKIYPTIKKILLAMIIPSLEVTELEHNNFELNGADFMITFDNEPALIEVNSVPALFFSKTVMKMITDKLLDDVIKVVVDQTKNIEAYTGDFELIYSQHIPQHEKVTDISIVGNKIERCEEKSSIRYGSKHKNITA